MNNATPGSVRALAQRVMARCDALSLHSEEPGRLTRRYLTEAMRSAHQQVRAWMEAAGMRVRVDAAGNLVGRHDTGQHNRVLLLGSHLDTVPDAGKYDGALGVLIGLAAVEALRGEKLPFAIDVIGFSEEEGVRYATPYIGSRAVVGTFDPNWLDRRDEDGVSMRSAIEAFGLDPSRIDEAAYEPRGVIGYIEAHIEQGPVLQRAGRAVGVVNAIAGQSRLIVRFEGEAGHAGTTPMSPRRDALVSAARLITEVREYGVSIAGLRATVGYARVHPNVRNVIPAEVDLSLDVRHAVDEVREAAVAALLDAAQRIAAADHVGFKVLEHQPQPATAVDGRLTGLLAQAMHDCGLEPFDLLSGAGHDAVAIAQRLPVAMLFIRHPGGVSHHPDERVEEGDVAVAIGVLAALIKRLAKEIAEEKAYGSALVVE